VSGHIPQMPHRAVRPDGIARNPPSWVSGALPGKAGMCTSDVACVQDQLHPSDRVSQRVLDECARRRITFAPFASLGFGSVSPNFVLEALGLVGAAARLGCKPAKV